MTFRDILGTTIGLALTATMFAGARAPAPAPPQGVTRYEMTATGWVDGVAIEPQTFDIRPELAGLFILASHPDPARPDQWMAVGSEGRSVVTYRLRVWYGPKRTK